MCLFPCSEDHSKMLILLLPFEVLPLHKVFILLYLVIKSYLFYFRRHNKEETIVISKKFSPYIHNRRIVPKREETTILEVQVII